MVSIVILALIAGYSVYVIRKKYRDMRNGKFCSGCGGDCRGCRDRRKQ